MIILPFFITGLKKFAKTAIVGLLVLFLIYLIPQINKQVNQAIERALTLEALAKGDLSAGGTLSRISERGGPRVMNKFYESPYFGFGFSDEFYAFVDGHVGNQSLLLNGGIFGYLLYLLYFLFSVSSYYYRNYQQTKNRMSLIFLATLLAVFFNFIVQQL